MMMNSGDYQNLIVLLKQALEFYANEKNYYFDETNYGDKSMVVIDNGTQARFALEKIEEMNQFYEGINTEYLDDLKKKVDDIKDDDIEGLMDTMKELKNLKNIITNQKKEEE